MIITFIHATTTWVNKGKFFRMELPIYAKLKALTPNDIECRLIDTRIEDIDYEARTDIIVISFNTMCTVNAYKIADKFRQKGKKVILGGIHVDLMPEEALEHADAICLGEAEMTWSDIISDLENGQLKTIYNAKNRYDMQDYKMDYSIFKNKHYFPVRLIETSRGCRFNCSFCTQRQVYKEITYRPIDEIIDEIKNTKYKYIFFTDDNFGNDKNRTNELLKKLVPLKKKYMAHLSVNFLIDEEFIRLLKKSGCLAIGIGFESIDSESLKSLNKICNSTDLYFRALKNCVKYDILVNAGFVSGTLADTIESVQKTFEFANSFQFFSYNFFNILPFPKTPIYNRLLSENKLLYERWWLMDNVNFYDIPLYYTDNIKAEEMTKIGKHYWQELFYLKNIFKRFILSEYRLKTRIFILLINLYLKYIGRSSTFM